MARNRTPRNAVRTLGIVVALTLVAAACGDAAETADPAPTTTSTVAPESATIAPASTEAFAIPTGPTFQEITTVMELRDLGESLLGPTDDMSGLIARLAEFPNVPTFIDTELTQVGVLVTADRDSETGESAFTDVMVEGVTSALRADVETAFQTSLFAAGFQVDLRAPNTFELPDGEASFNFSTVGRDDGTAFRVVYELFVESAPELVTSTTQWAEGGPWGDELLLSSALRASATEGTFEAEIRHDFVGQTEDELRAGEADRLADTPWMEVGQIQATTEVAVDGVPGSALITYTGGTADGVRVTTQWFTYGDDL